MAGQYYSHMYETKVREKGPERLHSWSCLQSCSRTRLKTTTHKSLRKLFTCPYLGCLNACPRQKVSLLNLTVVFTYDVVIPQGFGTKVISPFCDGMQNKRCVAYVESLRGYSWSKKTATLQECLLEVLQECERLMHMLTSTKLVNFGSRVLISRCTSYSMVCFSGSSSGM